VSTPFLEDAFHEYLRTRVLIPLHAVVIPQGVMDDPVATYALANADYDMNLSGFSGIVRYSFALTTWSKSYPRAIRGAEEFRLKLQGFKGEWGTFRVGAVTLDSVKDIHVREQDGGDVLYFGRESTYLVRTTAPKPTL